MSLDLKYRPADFDSVIGNESEIKTFMKNLDKEDGKHAFVIQGPAGCGKTTLGRIAAAYVGATKLSIKELNTGDNRGIDTTRQIIELMRYSLGSTQVFIIDEAHGLTPDAKRAFLKPTEEPPDHVYFFFLTTDPAKLFKGDEGKALKRRLEPVKVSNCKPKEIYKHLRRVCKKEDIEVSGDVLTYISENCIGSPGTALMMLGTILDLEDEDSMMEKLENIVLSEDPEVFEFCRVLFGKNPNWKKLANMLLAFKEKKDPEEIRRMVMGYAQSVLLKSGSGSAGYILECFCDYQYSSGFPGITLATFQAINGK